MNTGLSETEALRDGDMLFLDGKVYGPVTRTHRGEFQVTLPDFNCLAAPTLTCLIKRINEEELTGVL